MELLPAIREQIHFAFRHETPERRQELSSEAIANCWVAFVRLVERGMEEVIYATPLVQYAVRHVRSGRKVGGTLNKNGVASEYAQRSRGFRMGRFIRFNQRKQQWVEILVEDRKAGPAETAAARIDIPAWLATLGERRRRIAEALASGESTAQVAKKFERTAGRVSQLRRELKASWETFQDDAVSVK